MTRWLQLSSYPAIVLFLLMGVCAAGFAWLSYNLFHLSMENLRFLRMAGWLAVAEGGLNQLAGIIANGLAALACYIGFKACEVELVHRWRSYRAGR